jgi:N-acyl-D-amino-acid deacylase
VDYDLILKNGWVIDGTGGPPFRADVALLDASIAEVGRLDGAGAARVLDVADRYVVPGFIDAHVHGDLMLLADPIHLPALRQGVTTYIIGQDGSAFAPAGPATLDYMRRYTAGFNGNPPEVDAGWRTVDEYLARFDRATALNVAYLIPNGNVRMEVMGLDPRPARDDELEAMQALVRRGAPRSSPPAASTSRTCGATARRPRRGWRKCTRSPGRRACRPTSRTITARPTSCSP